MHRLHEVAREGLPEDAKNHYKHGGYVKPKYFNCRVGLKKGLARARAMSLLYEFGNCPVVSSYARCIIRCTNGTDIRRALFHLERDDWYKFEQIHKAVLWYESSKDTDYTVGEGSRLVIEQRFGIPRCTQLYMEAYFDSLTTDVYPVEFVVPCLDLVCPPANEQFYATHTLINRDVRIPSSVRVGYRDWETDWKSTRLNSSHSGESRMPSSA